MKISKIIKLVALFLLISVSGSLFGQFTFDNCQYAQNINIEGGYCSGDSEFSNINATPDPTFPNGCVNVTFQNGVWFSFIPTQQAISVRVFCNGVSGTMIQPKIVLFDDCSSYIQCSPGSTNGTDEFVYEKLTLGKTYYVMIESSTAGSFKICIDQYTPIPSPQSDCKDGVILCDKSSFIVQSLTTNGSVTNEIEPGNCMFNSQFPSNSEKGSSWYKWTCETSGDLTFTLTPNDFVNANTISDDLDFAVYELPNGIDDCNGKILLRCMASGANGTNNMTDPLSTWKLCNGKTGLRSGESDNTEDPGCQGNSNNFAAPLNMIAGKSYVLIVNNFSNGGLGFGIDFGGSGTFLGPQADFDIEALQEFECDKTIRFSDLSESLADNIVSYSWSFGDGASPNSSTNSGPIDVIYDSFGDKIVALTVESERGCLVTKLLPIFVEPCCDDINTLELDVTSTDLRCAGIPEGTLLGMGKEGFPPYMYSLDGVNYQSVPIFYNLNEGQYDVHIIDRKGCEYQESAIIDAPPPLIVNAGRDTIIDLGETINLQATYTPITSIVDITWMPTSGFTMCEDCLDPEIKVPGTTSYIISIIDQNGCTDLDTVIVHTNIVRPVIAPNILTIDSRDGNSEFFISVGPAVDQIKSLKIYDRWGNQVYSSSNIAIDDPHGWDGYFRGQAVDPAVFAWVAEVHFIDDVTLTYTGDLTVVR